MPAKTTATKAKASSGSSNLLKSKQPVNKWGLLTLASLVIVAGVVFVFHIHASAFTFKTIKSVNGSWLLYPNAATDTRPYNARLAGIGGNNYRLCVTAVAVSHTSSIQIGPANSGTSLAYQGPLGIPTFPVTVCSSPTGNIPSSRTMESVLYDTGAYQVKVTNISWQLYTLQ